MTTIWSIDGEQITQRQIQEKELSNLLMRIYDNLNWKWEVLKILISYDDEWSIWVADIFYKERE
jgi:hypothetical protein